MEGYLAQIIMFAGNFEPRFWAYCQGQILSISQNTALFSLLGTTYGGNGQSTFALPDLRSRTPVGTGQGPGLPYVDLGEQWGQESITLTTNTMPAHNHTVAAEVKVSSFNANLDQPNGAALATGDNSLFAAPASANGNLAAGTLSLGNAGSNQPFSIRQPYVGMNFIICLQGIFPSRN